MPRWLANGSKIVTHIKILHMISCKNEMNAPWDFIWQRKDQQQHKDPANWGAASIESACTIQSNVMAGIVGSPCFDSYLYSQKLPFLNLSIHHELFFMHSWDRTSAEIRYRLHMIWHELQAYKICGGREHASHRLSHCAESGIQILSHWALLMEIGS